MSKKSSKLDLLVRVRFENPLPDPPFPPKLLKIDTDITRLGDPAYLDQLATSSQLPMILDSEMGMPIDLSAFDGVFDGNEGALNPSGEATLDAEDQALLQPLRVLGSAPKPEVSWMRNSSYIQRVERSKRRAAAETQAVEVVDASEAAQIIAIEKTFSDIRNSSLDDIRHPDPKRKHLRVVESYDILPDEETWANQYILLKYPERPNAATASNPSAQASRERLERAMLRPTAEEEAEDVVEFFLPAEGDLDQFEKLENELVDAEAVDRLGDDVPHVVYDRIRTYEQVSQAKPNKEYLLTFVEEAKEEDEDDMFGDEEPARKKRKGVYVKEIFLRTQLRKTRALRRGSVHQRSDMWDKVRVAFREQDAEEAQGREHADERMRDPGWIENRLASFSRGEKDSDEEVSEGDE